MRKGNFSLHFRIHIYSERKEKKYLTQRVGRAAERTSVGLGVQTTTDGERVGRAALRLMANGLGVRLTVNS